jgi:thiamine-phosphate pyrophosphorylase
VILEVVTNRARLCGTDADRRRVRQCVRRQAAYAVDAGVGLFQIREPGLEAGDLLALATEVVTVASGTSMRVVINDRLDVALACGAAGVHLRQDSFPPSSVRSMTPSGFIIGCSVHSVAGAVAAAGTADYLVAGTVWPSASKPSGHRLLGLDGLAAIVRAVRVPVLAIGGVTLDRMPEVAKAGAAGVAAIELFLGPTDEGSGVRCRAVDLARLVETARARFDTSRSAS